MTSPTFKKQYTVVLSLVFIGIGCYKLYDRFYAGNEVAPYQVALAGFLILLGFYQLFAPSFKKR